MVSLELLRALEVLSRKMNVKSISVRILRILSAKVAHFGRSNVVLNHDLVCFFLNF